MTDLQYKLYCVHTDLDPLKILSPISRSQGYEPTAYYIDNTESYFNGLFLRRTGLIVQLTNITHKTC